MEAIWFILVIVVLIVFFGLMIAWGLGVTYRNIFAGFARLVDRIRGTGELNIGPKVDMSGKFLDPLTHEELQADKAVPYKIKELNTGITLEIIVGERVREKGISCFHEEHRKYGWNLLRNTNYFMRFTGDTYQCGEEEVNEIIKGIPDARNFRRINLGETSSYLLFLDYFDGDENCFRLGEWVEFDDYDDFLGARGTSFEYVDAQITSIKKDLFNHKKKN